ncbi:MAG: ribonuclease P protein component [Fulvivirga sp.]
MIRKTFKKSERLSAKTLIKELFDKGSSFYLYPFKVLFLPTTQSTTQLLISVPKKNHKTAVARNQLKRRIREAYRLNKEYLPTEKNFLIAYIYTSRDINKYSEIEKSIIAINQRIKNNADEKA